MKAHYLRTWGWHGFRQRYTLCGLDERSATTTPDQNAVTCMKCERKLAELAKKAG